MGPSLRYVCSLETKINTEKNTANDYLPFLDCCLLPNLFVFPPKHILLSLFASQRMSKRPPACSILHRLYPWQTISRVWCNGYSRSTGCDRSDWDSWAGIQRGQMLFRGPAWDSLLWKCDMFRGSTELGKPFLLGCCWFMNRLGSESSMEAIFMTSPFSPELCYNI